MMQKRTLALIAALVALTALYGGVPAAAQESNVREEINCLALNIYFEARSEPISGKVAVGHVVMNRVADARYPDKVCEVVKQGGEKPRNKCQFSWFCDGRSDHPANVKAWKESLALARVIYWGYSQDPTDGALWYHADYVRPHWRRALERGPKIGRHVFYASMGGAGRRQVPGDDVPQAARERVVNKDDAAVRPVKVRTDAKTT